MPAQSPPGGSPPRPGGSAPRPGAGSGLGGSPAGGSPTGGSPTGGSGSGAVGPGAPRAPQKTIIGTAPLKTSPPKAEPTPSSPPNRPRRRSLPPGGTEPAVLFVGADQGFGKAVANALVRHGMFLEMASPDEAVETAVVAAPDLIVLTGVAAADSGSKLLRELASRAETSSIPVALVQDDTALDVRLRAFRHGAAAILPKKASVDELASKIAELAHEIPGRSDEALGELGEVTLEELVKTLGAELRSGILSVGNKDGDEAIRLVLGSGRPLAKLIEEFVQKARTHVVRAEPLRYEFDARAGGTVQLFDAEAAHPLSQGSIGLEGLRVVLADENSGRSDAVAGELRRHGAEVIVSELRPNDMRFSQMRGADPSVLLIGEEHIQGEGYELLRRMRRDTRLRWTALLVVRWDELWTDVASAPVERLASTLISLTEPERNLRAQAEAGSGLDARLEMVGPARTLRSLARSTRGFRLTITNPRLWAELDVANGLVVGALARTSGETPVRTFEGTEALAALLQLSTGRLQIDPVDHPARANVMSAVDMALSIADGERPPINPSMPAGPPSSPAPFVPPPGPRPVFADDVLEELSAEAVSPAAPAPLERGPESVDLLLGGPESSVPRRPAAVRVHTEPPSVRNFESARTEPPPPGFPAEPPAAQPSVAPRQPAARPSAAPQPPAAQRQPVVSQRPQAPAAPPAAAYASIDERLRRLLLVDENGLSPSLLAVLGALALLELFWILLLVAAAAPSHAARLEPAPGSSGPIAESSAEAPSARATSKSATTEPKDGGGDPRLEALPLADGSGTQAKSCDALLAGTPKKDGQYPGLAFDLARRGKQALISGRLESSHELYCRASSYDAQSSSIWLSLAQVYMLKRDGAQAAAAAERGYKLAPDDTAIQAVLADALARRGEVERARSLWISAARLDAGDPSTKSKLSRRDALEGERAVRRGDAVYAERMYRRVALLVPEKSDGAVGLARALLTLKEPGPAGRWADYAVSVDPGNAEPHLVRGDVYQAEGRLDQARREWQDAVRLDPANNDAQARLRG